MLLLALLLQLSIWVTVSSAFHIWEPCRVDGTCPEKEEGDGYDARRGAKRSRPVTLEIHQRAGGQYDRRENRYPVMAPADPEHPDAVGIFQDGKDYTYFVKAAIGSAKQALYMLVDTGAGSTWVMGSRCTTEPCQLHDTFDPATSTTFKKHDLDFTVKYGKGKVSGTTGTDTMRIGDVEVSMRFGVADTASDDFKHFPFDGILGMAPAEGKTDNFPVTLQDDKAMGSNVFAVYLSRGASGQNRGELTLGGINEDRVEGGALTYTGVPKDHKDWAVPLGDVGVVGGKALGVQGRLAHIDTGTSFIFAPKADVKALHGLIPGATSGDDVNWQVPCGTKEKLYFSFSGKAFEVLPQDWVQAKGDKGMCKSNVYGKAVVKNEGWLLGAVYLKNVYAVFDMDERRIGFSQLAEVSAPEPSPTDDSPSPSATTTEDMPPMGVGGPSSGFTSEASSSGEAESTGGSPSPPKGEEGASARALPQGPAALAAVVAVVLAGACLY